MELPLPESLSAMPGAPGQGKERESQALRKSLSQPSPAQPLPGSTRAGQWPSGPGQQGMGTWQERCPSCLVLLCWPRRALRAPSPRAEGCAGWEGTPELCCSGQCLPCRAGLSGATSALQQGFPQHCLPPSLPMALLLELSQPELFLWPRAPSLPELPEPSPAPGPALPCSCSRVQGLKNSSPRPGHHGEVMLQGSESWGGGGTC